MPEVDCAHFDLSGLGCCTIPVQLDVQLDVAATGPSTPRTKEVLTDVPAAQRIPSRWMWAEFVVVDIEGQELHSIPRVRMERLADPPRTFRWAQIGLTQGPSRALWSLCGCALKDPKGSYGALHRALEVPIGP